MNSVHKPVQNITMSYTSFRQPSDFGTQSTTLLSFQTDTEEEEEDHYFTLDSSTLSDPPYRGSPSGFFSTGPTIPTRPDTGFHYCSEVYMTRRRTIVPSLDLNQALISCARSIADGDITLAVNLMDMVEPMVSVSGAPIQRLGAYLLEGLRARLECSGSSIYQKLRCDVPTGPDLMSAMYFLYEICPYWKFGYTAANDIILKAVEGEVRIHIIDFQIAQGSQWVPLIKALATRPGGPPTVIRITGVDDPESAHARGGGLGIVGRRLSRVAESSNVRFEFSEATMFGHEVNLRILPGETLAVNFPYVLHHVPDESVSTDNHRDRLLRRVRTLNPKIITLIEQESNTNTSPFFSRFLETLDYYTAMFESIGGAHHSREDEKRRISAEQHCVARDIVNMVACEGAERVERHELLGKWRSRLSMAGFRQCRLGPSVGSAARDMLREYSAEYRIEERDGALYLGWKNRAMSTCSAWTWT